MAQQAPLKFRQKQEILNDFGNSAGTNTFRLELETQLDQRDELHAQRVQLARVACVLEAILEEIKKPVVVKVPKKR